MADVRIQVTPDEVRRTARAIDADVIRFKDSYTNVYRASDEMTGHWAGKDNVEYNRSIEKYRTIFTQMEELMREYITFLERSATEYRGTQDDVTDRARRI